MNKRSYRLIGLSLLIIVTALLVYLYTKPTTNDKACNLGMTGECLPKGQCLGGSDSIVDCNSGRRIDL